MLSGSWSVKSHAEASRYGQAHVAASSIGERAGPGFAYDDIVPAIERIITTYLEQRESPAETFLAAYRRLGLAPFKAALYPAEGSRDAA